MSAPSHTKTSRWVRWVVMGCLTFGLLLLSLLLKWKPGMTISGLALAALVLVFAPRPRALVREGTDGGFLIIAYVLALVLGVVALAGQIQRGEQPFWIGAATWLALERHGLVDAVLIYCAYGLLYSAPFALCYGVLSIVDAMTNRENPQGNSALSLWCGLTVFLFWKSIFGALDVFIEHAPTDIAGGWAMVLWLIVTLAIGAYWAQVTFRPNSNLWDWVKENYTVSELERLAMEEAGLYLGKQFTVERFYRSYGNDIWHVCLGGFDKYLHTNVIAYLAHFEGADVASSPSRFEEFMVRRALQCVARQLLDAPKPPTP